MSNTDPSVSGRAKPHLTFTEAWRTSTGDNCRGHVNGGASTLLRSLPLREGAFFSL